MVGLIGSIMIKKDHTEIGQPIQKHAPEKGDWHTNNEFLEIDIAFILLTQNKNLIAKYSVNRHLWQGLKQVQIDKY